MGTSPVTDAMSDFLRIENNNTDASHPHPVLFS